MHGLTSLHRVGELSLNVTFGLVQTAAWTKPRVKCSFDEHDNEFPEASAASANPRIVECYFAVLLC